MPQRANEYQFGRAVALAVAIADATMAQGLADAGPVSCAVDRAAIALCIDEGFQQQQRLVETREPVRIDTALTPRQYFRSELGAMPAGQDQKTAVVGDLLEAPVLVPEVPSNPLVACSALQCPSSKSLLDASPKPRALFQVCPECLVIGPEPVCCLRVQPHCLISGRGPWTYARISNTPQAPPGRSACMRYGTRPLIKELQAFCTRWHSYCIH